MPLMIRRALGCTLLSLALAACSAPAASSHDVDASTAIDATEADSTEDQSSGGCAVLDCPPSTAQCMINACQADKSCKLVAAQDGTACDDGDLCTVLDGCTATVCAGTAKPCQDALPCTEDGCLSTTGACKHDPSSAACDDGNACTLNDKCQGGVCGGETNTACECLTDSDCAAKEDGDACNGTLYCDKSGDAYKCKVNPATLVQCLDPDPSDCVNRSCDKKLGVCIDTATKEFSPCDDGNVCTLGDTCKLGACVSGSIVCKCTANADCAKYEDGNACNGLMFCDLSSGDPALIACKVNPSTLVTCPNAWDTACSQNTCDKATGACAQVPTFGSNVPCDDGNACSTGDICSGGKCTSGTNTCSCSANADCAAKEDGDLCNGTLFCNLSASGFKCEVNPATVVACPGGNDSQCLRTVCNPSNAQCLTLPTEQTVKKKPACQEATQKCDYVPAPPGAAPVYSLCDDGNPCTSAEVCSKGQCQASAYLCFCQKDGDCKDDGDLCNGLPYCDKAAGTCKTNPATVVACSTTDDTACVHNKCDKASGTCVLTPGLNVPCDDGNACTNGDVCNSKSGQCISGTNICTCAVNGDCAGKGDGNPCHGALYCDLTVSPNKCVVNPATVVSCSAAFDSECQANGCDKMTGKCAMKLVSGFKLCSDGNPCTIGDECKQGECTAGTNTCVCEVDGDCAAKEDGDACNGTLFCDKTQKPFNCMVNPKTVVICSAASDSACASNACDPATGACGLAAASTFTVCDDGNPCTKGDHCQGGQCAPGGNACPCQIDADCGSVDDANVCNGQLFCDKMLGSCATAAGSAVTCATGGDSECLKNTCMPATGACAMTSVASACDDGNACTADSCGGGKCGHESLSNGTACPGGKVCNAGQCLVN